MARWQGADEDRSKLLDVRGVLDALPTLSLDAGPTVEQERARATGTDALGPSAVAPLVALNRGNGRQTGLKADKAKAEHPIVIGPARLDASLEFSSDSAIMPGVSASGFSVCPTGVEPVTFSSGG
jgi:hypothetical protein